MTAARRPNAFLRRLGLRAGTSRRGVSAMEFALIAPTMMLVVTAVADLGNALHQSIKLETAARAGAQYAISFPTSTSAIQDVVRTALPGWSNVTIASPTMQCECDGAAVACTTTCFSGIQRYVTVSVTRPYSPMMFSNLSTLTGRVQIRIQ